MARPLRDSLGLLLVSVIAALVILAAASVSRAAASNVLFEETFEGPAISHPHQTSGSGAVYDPDQKAVKITSVKPGGDYLIFPLDEKQFRGKKVQLEAMVKGEGLSQSATPYFNSKLKVSFDTNAGVEKNPETTRKSGTYDWWKPLLVFRIPDDASDIKLTIGLQDVTGTYWVKNLRILEIPVYPGQPYTPSTAPLQKAPRYRGIDTSRKTDWMEQDFKDLKQWHVNLFRYQMLPFDLPIKTREQFSVWIDIEMKKIDRFLILAEKYGMKAVLDLQVGPGTDSSQLGSNIMSWDKRDQELLVEVWRRMAGHYKGNRTIYAYDILNEPREDDFVYDPDGGVEWQLLAERTIEAIRKIDPDTPILVEAAAWSNPTGFLTLKPINGKNLIYSPHWYLPHNYTHQGIYKEYATAFTYPGPISGVRWDREQMLKSLEPVIAFQKKYNVPIYIGEFSVVRWAPGGERWLDDAISIFEEHGWDWSYHAFREYDGWSVEHGPEKADATVKATTARKEVLLKYLGRNAPPVAAGNP